MFNFSQSLEKAKQKTVNISPRPQSIFLPPEMYMDYIPES